MTSNYYNRFNLLQKRKIKKIIKINFLIPENNNYYAYYYTKLLPFYYIV